MSKDMWAVTSEGSCSDPAVGEDDVKVAVSQLVDAIRSNGGTCYGFVVSFNLPCTKKVNMFHDDVITAVEDKLSPEDVVVLRRDIDRLKKHLDEHYPPA